MIRQRLEGIFARRLEDDWKTFLQDALKASWKRLEDVLQKHVEDILKTSSRRFEHVFKTSSRCLAKMSQDVFKTYHQIKLFLLNTLLNTSIQHVSETYCKDGYLQRDLPRSHFWEIYGQRTKFARVMKISQVLVFHFTTHFCGGLQRRI